MLTRVGTGKAKITKKLLARVEREAVARLHRHSSKPPRPKREGFVQPRFVVFVASLLLSILVLAGGEPVMAEAAPTSGYSATALYNEANARAREGKVGAAILNYERARLLAPSDPDIAANLKLVREHAGLSEPMQNGVAQILNAVRPGTGAWFGSFGLVVAGLGILLAPRMPKHRLALWLLSGMGAFVVALAISQAVVLSPQMNMAFTLREGETVTIIAERQDFVLVKNHAGLSGWVAAEELARIVPDSDQLVASVDQS